MNLVQLVNYFRKGGVFNEFCHLQNLDLESEVIEIFMLAPLGLDNELAFFEMEKISEDIELVYESNVYVNLFNFYYFLDAIEESNSPQYLNLSDEEIARRLFDYAINDA